MREYLAELLTNLGVPPTPWLLGVSLFITMALVCLIIYLVLLYALWGSIRRFNNKNPKAWVTQLIDSNIFTLLVLVFEGVIVNLLVRLWLTPGGITYQILESGSRLWIMIFAMLAGFAAINLANRLCQNTSIARKIPIHGIGQALKLIISLVFIILLISTLLGRSPVILLSGLGAMTAVIMLVFKDPIMGFVSGVQLSSYDLLAVGDWLEMPKYNANGTVLEIGMTTVKVQNFDKTIITIPTYALMSDSFKNWRGMQQSGGRRIKRSLNIDITSIRFLNDADFERLHKARLLSDYLEHKAREIDEFNQNLNADMSTPVNGRRLTNIGTFRAYLTAYLKTHPRVHNNMTMMVRQLAPTGEGLPLEVYCFTNTTEWVDYEGIQSDIFDHIYAVLPEFDLRAFQAPTGNDFRSLAA